MTDSGEIAIDVQHVSKTFKLPHEKLSSVKGVLINFARHRRGYEKQQVLNDVSFNIKKGEFFGIVGRNGSGKSTLLKLLAGIYTPDSGNIQINGKLTPFIELGVGFNPELTGRENVFLNGALLGFNRSEMEAMYDDIVAFAELERFMDQKLKNYSSGMQVRLAFSIAIRAQSDILVLDEVLAVGDAAFQKKCFDYFKQLRVDGRTVVLVSHDMGAIEAHCDRAVLIHAGEIVDDGDPREIAAKYRLLNLPERQVETAPELFGNVTIHQTTINGTNEVVVDEHAPLEIAVRYSAKKSTRVIVGLSFFADDGNHIAYYDTRNDHTVPVKEDVSYLATCRFNANQFISGSYQVNVDLYDEHGVYLAKQKDAVRFSVMDTNPAKAGVFNLQGAWHVAKKK